ncbi:MAG: zf-HC2 domain-containing protein [Nitrolancea sp.]
MTSRPSQHGGEGEDASHLTEDDLSDLINGDLADAGNRDRVQAHLDECAECRERHSELRAVVTLLRRVESPVPSRSFKLTPEMVGPRPVEIDPWIVRIQPAMRRVTAIAAALLLLIVVADGLRHSGTSNGSKSVAVNFSTSAETSAGGASQSLGVAPAATEAATSAARDSAAAASTESQAVTSSSAAATPTAPTVSAGSSAPSQSEPPTTASQSSQAHTSYWRLAELAAGVVVMWLLFITIALPRLHVRRDA